VKNISTPDDPIGIITEPIAPALGDCVAVNFPVLLLELKEIVRAVPRIAGSPLPCMNSILIASEEVPAVIVRTAVLTLIPAGV